MVNIFCILIDCDSFSIAILLVSFHFNDNLSNSLKAPFDIPDAKYSIPVCVIILPSKIKDFKCGADLIHSLLNSFRLESPIRLTI